MKYLRKITFEKDWNGDHVTVVMDPLDRESFIRLASMRGESASDVERYRATMEALDKHVLSISGLKDAAGVEIDKETVLNKVFFSTLVNAMGQALMEGSMVPKVSSSEFEEKSPAGIAVQR